MLRCSRRITAVVVSSLLGAGASGLLATRSQATSEPVSTTTTSIGFELSDDFLTLYPEYNNDDYEYLVPDDTTLPATGPAVRVGVGALAVLAAGAIMFALSRGPRRRREPRP